MTEYIIAVLDSNAFVALIVGIAAYYAAQGYATAISADGPWVKYKQFLDRARPYLIGAVKFAEERIPDDTPNKAMAKANTALKYAQVLLASANIATPLDQLRQAVSDIHEELEQKDKLPLPVASSDEPSLSTVEPELPELN